MKFMKKHVLFLSTFVISSGILGYVHAETKTMTETQPKTILHPNLEEPKLPIEGWQQLFNGKDIDGWSFVGLGNFMVKDGSLVSGGKTGILWYNQQKFGNCVVRAIYKVNDPEVSSAVFVQMPHAPIDIWDAVNSSYQIKIMDNVDEYRRTGAIYSLSKARIAPTKPAGQWNKMDIFLQGKNVAVYVNGELVSSYDPNQISPPRTASSDPERGPRPENGYIGIENHNDLINDAMGQISFREISVLPLDSKQVKV